jgi:poly-gamma-glutamate capsule biosynthesis protein CapA/YwtB (metallophosphatase superfamily)
MIKTDDFLSIVIAGDLCPINRVEEYCNNNLESKLSEDFIKDLSEKDFSIVNLECPLTSSEKAIPKIGPNLYAKEIAVSSIKSCKFDAVTLANNHIMDFGKKGLIDTIEILNKNNISYVGAGENLKSARKPLKFKIRNRKLCILNYSDPEFSEAEQNLAGCNPIELINIIEDIEQVKHNSDIIIVIFHGGIEGYNLPSPQQRKLYRFVASLGVSAILAHHSHCASGVELVNKVPIFYSLGNFIFDYKNNNDEAIFKSYFVKLLINENNIVEKFNLFPYYQNRSKVGLEKMSSLDEEVFLKKINRISSIIENDDEFFSSWTKYLEDQNYWRLNLLILHPKLLRILFRIKFIKKIILKILNLTMIFSVINCNAHLEVLKDNLRRTIKNKVKYLHD